MKKGVLKNFAIFTGEYLCQSLYVSCTVIKKETLVRGFSCEFCKKNNCFTEHLWMIASILQLLLALYITIMYSYI